MFSQHFNQIFFQKTFELFGVQKIFQIQLHLKMVLLAFKGFLFSTKWRHIVFMWVGRSIFQFVLIFGIETEFRFFKTKFFEEQDWFNNCTSWGRVCSLGNKPLTMQVKLHAAGPQRSNKRKWCRKWNRQKWKYSCRWMNWEGGGGGANPGLSVSWVQSGNLESIFVYQALASNFFSLYI